MPLAAQSPISPWYPLRWPELVWGERMLAWHALASLALAGLGMALFLRARRHSSTAVLVGAIAYQCGGFAITNLHYGMRVDAALALPWALWAVEGVRARRRYARVALALALGTAFLAGFPPIAFFVLAATATYALTRAIGDVHAGELSAAQAFGRFAPPLLVALALGAVALVPMAEASALALRGPRNAAELFAERLPAAAISTLFLPNLLGGPGDGYFAPHDPLAWWLCGPGASERASLASALEWNLSAGVGVLVLAVAGLVAAPRRALWPAIALLGALGFAFGWPLVRLLYHVPGLDLGAPLRATAVAWTCWPILAAIGVDALLAGRARAIVAVLVLGGAAAVLGESMSRSIDPVETAARMESDLAQRYGKSIEEVRAVVRPEDGVRAVERWKFEALWLARLGGLAVACGIVPWLFSRLRRNAGHGVLTALAWSALALVEGARLASEQLVPRAAGPLCPSSAAIEAVREAAGDGRVLRYDASAAGIGDVLALARPNLLGAYGIADLTPRAIFPPRSLALAFRAIDPAARDAASASRLSDLTRLGHPLLDLLRVTAILSVHALEHPLLVPIYEPEGFHVYRRAGGAEKQPLAWMAPRVRVVGSTDARALRERGAYERADPWIEGDPARMPAQSAEGTAWRPGEILVQRPAMDRLDVGVRGTSGGWLLFSEQHLPGWKATVNGADAEIERAYGLLRAIAIPPGDSIVRTKYEPTSLRAGATLTIGALLVLAWWVRREREPRTA